jgi:hypothetical protein
MFRLRSVAAKMWIPVAMCLYAGSVVGCSNSTAVRPVEPTTATNEAASPGGSSTATSTTATAAARAAVINAPDQAITAAFRAMEEGRWHDAFDALPTSYQQQVDQLVHDFAGRVDIDLWENGFDVLNKVVQVLEEKQSLILAGLDGPEPGAENPMLEDLRREWPQMVAALKTLVRSDLGNLQALKTASTRTLLQESFSPLMTQLHQRAKQFSDGTAIGFSDSPIELVSIEQDKAVVRFTPPGQEPSERFEFVRVEGKWIPAYLAEQWTSWMTTARSTLNEITPEAMEQQRPQILQIMSLADSTADRLLAAETQDEFRAALAPIVFRAYQAMPTSLLGPADGTNGEGRSDLPPPVTIVVPGDLTEPEQTQLLKLLEPLTDDAERSEYTLAVAGGKTLVQIQPVSNPEEFSKRVSAIWGASELDAETRTITLSEKPMLSDDASQ